MTASRVARLFAPRSIALVGASERGMYPAGILRDLQRYGFDGAIYPVNPRRKQVCGLCCYPNLAALPQKPDLAVILVPRTSVPDVIDECLALGIPAAVIITAGFRESDAEGAVLEETLRERIQGSNLTVLGPNCAGLADLMSNTVITRLPTPPLRGHVGFVSASGALIMGLQGVFADCRLGLSRLISVGNQLDVTLTDVLAYLVEDDATQVLGAFVEGLEDGRRFVQVATDARRAGKPLVLVKSGRTAAGQEAAATHTAALAGSDRIFQAACRTAGAVLVDDIDEMARTLQLFAAWAGRYPRGRQLAIVTQSGGIGSLTADLATLAGFDLPALPPVLQAQLQAMEHLLAFDAFGNPADVRGAGAVGAEAALTLAPVLADPAFDAVVLLLAKSAVEEREVATAQALAALASTVKKPFCIVWVGQRIAATDEHTEAPLRILAAAGIPVFAQPSDCIDALARVVDWQVRQATGVEETAPWPEAVPRPAAEPARWLSYAETEALLAAYEIALAPARVVADANGAADAAEALSFPVALKGMAENFAHKSDAGLVHLNLANRQQIAAAVCEIRRAVGEAADVYFLVQRMAQPGVEALLGIENDAQFGPVVVCGPGGVLVELLDDVALGLAPLSPTTAQELIDATRLTRLLRSVRGRPPGDRAALVELLVKLSRLAWEQSARLVSLDINPVILHSNGLFIVDVRVQWRGNIQ